MDLAGEHLEQVTAPCLFIVGGCDTFVLDLNREAAGRMRIEPRLEVVPDATHLFEEPGALEHVGELTVDWFRTHLGDA